MRGTIEVTGTLMNKTDMVPALMMLIFNTTGDKEKTNKTPQMVVSPVKKIMNRSWSGVFFRGKT